MTGCKGIVAPHLSASLLDGTDLQAIGLWQDQYFYCRLQPGDYVMLRARQHGPQGIFNLFSGRVSLVMELWPRFDKRGRVTGWNPERAAESLMHACAIKGVIDPREYGFFLAESGRWKRLGAAQ